MSELKSYGHFTYFKSTKFLRSLQEIVERHDGKIEQNYDGCWIKANPKLFGFFVYWACVDRLSPIALYFPYLVLTLAFVLVLLERILTRYMWTGQRIDKFYNLLVKEVMSAGDIDQVDTKENRQKCRQIQYDFKGSWFYSKAYIGQTALKLFICLTVITWSLFDQCNQLRESFHTSFQCRIFDYTHECAIPSNGMNLAIFDLVNLVLLMIFLVAAFSFNWHLRFKRIQNDSKCNQDSFLQKWRQWRSTQLTRLIDSYYKNLLEQNGVQDILLLKEEDRVLHEVYTQSADMQMLLNLITEKEGIWSALLILSLFDKKFKNEFKVRDSQITSLPCSKSSKRRDVTIGWNEPEAASFLGQNVPTEHLMYVLEIDPPLDKKDADGITLMPACSLDGNCKFSPVRKESKEESINIEVSKGNFSRQSSSSSLASSSEMSTNPDKGMTIIDGTLKEESNENPHVRKSINLRRKAALLYGRKKSADKVRNFKSTLPGLRNDTEYIIKISFVLSGRKLGSESYRILCNDGQNCQRKSSLESSMSTPKSSMTINPTQKNSIMRQLLLNNSSSLNSSSDSEQQLIAKSSEEVKVLLKFNSNSNFAIHKRLVILEFVASWCGLCKKISPQMEEMSEAYANKSVVIGNTCKEIIFIRADVDECQEAAENFDVNVLPSALLIEQSSGNSHDILSTHFGQQVTRIKDEIESWIHFNNLNIDDDENVHHSMTSNEANEHEKRR